MGAFGLSARAESIEYAVNPAARLPVVAVCYPEAVLSGVEGQIIGSPIGAMR